MCGYNDRAMTYNFSILAKLSRFEPAAPLHCQQLPRLSDLRRLPVPADCLLDSELVEI